MSENKSVPMKCDVCSKPGLGHLIPAEELKKAVKEGYHPYRFNQLPETANAQVVVNNASERFIAEWKKLVETNRDDWNICENCYSFISMFK